jgi:predicted HTH domain antitoxin
MARAAKGNSISALRSRVREDPALAAVKLFELGELSSGAAAELAGIHRIEFLERLKDYGVAAIQGTADDLQHDLEALWSFRS